jgi:hypothetical protein
MSIVQATRSSQLRNRMLNPCEPKQGSDMRPVFLPTSLTHERGISAAGFYCCGGQIGEGETPRQFSELCPHQYGPCIKTSILLSTIPHV